MCLGNSFPGLFLENGNLTKQHVFIQPQLIHLRSFEHLLLSPLPFSSSVMSADSKSFKEDSEKVVVTDADELQLVKPPV